MKFSETEIELAHQLKVAGLNWQPTPGHYVWDGEPLIRHDSPFHDRVFFILDLKHFLRRSETTQRLVDSMVWLPTWQQCRELLAQQGQSHEDVMRHLVTCEAFQRQAEREELYRLLLKRLTP